VLIVFGYFGVPFIAGVIIGITDPSILEANFMLNVISIFASLLGVLIIYLILERVVKKKKLINKKGFENLDLLDNDMD